jgi:hypothetical protein
MSDVILLTLGRWSVGVQLGIVCLLALFFATLVRTVKLEEVRLWAGAWLADRSSRLKTPLRGDGRP